MDEFTSISFQFNFKSILAWNWMKLSLHQTSAEISFLTQGKICLVPMWPHCFSTLWLFVAGTMRRGASNPGRSGDPNQGFPLLPSSKRSQSTRWLKIMEKERNLNSSCWNKGRVSERVLLGDSRQASQRGSLSHRQRSQCEFNLTTNKAEKSKTNTSCNWVVNTQW